jgi:hypothetical protein
MLDEVATAIATGAAGNVIAYMLNGRVDALRAQLAGMFRHGTPQERTRILRGLDTDARALKREEVSEADLTERWINLLVSYLAQHPEARSDIEAFSSLHTTSRIINIGSQNNVGSGIFIGGDNHGEISLRGEA